MVLQHDPNTGTEQMLDLTRALVRCRDLQEMIDAGSDALGVPLILTDGSFRILAFTAPEKVSDAAYRELVQADILPADNPENGASETEEWETVQYPSYSGEKVDLPAVLCRRLAMGGQTDGYLHALGNIPDASAAELIGHFLAVTLWDKPENTDTGSDTRRAERQFRAALDGSLAGEELEGWKRSIGLSPDGELYIAVISSGRSGVPVQEAFHDLYKLLPDHLPGSLCVLYRDSAYILIHADGPITDIGTVFAPILPFVRKHQLFIGVSSAFDFEEEILPHGFQAYKALQLGRKLRPEETIHLYEDYIIYYMTELCLKEEQPEMLCSPELRRLAEHDPKDGGELLRTLRTYLNCGQSKSRAARELNIHLNTVKYRLTQAQKLMGLDPDDRDNAMRLRLSLAIQEYSAAFLRSQPEG